MKPYQKNISFFFIAIILFSIIAIAYMSPALQGKKVSQHDITMHIGMSKELVDFRNDTGEEGLWTNSVFGGMPAYLISTKYKSNLMRWAHYLLLLNNWRPVGFIFLYLFGFFIAMLAFGVDRWLSLVGAIAYGFSSYFLVIIVAGHNSKVFALGYMPAVIAGVYLVYKDRYLLGAAILSLFLSLQIYVNHLQITYYTFLIILIFGIFQLVETIKTKSYKQFITASSIIILAILLGFGSNFSKLWTTYEYGKYSIRGKSELKLDNDNQTSGLDKDYATDYSYGIDETLTLLIPNFKGGASGGALPESSETYAFLKQIQGAKAAKKSIKQMPTYWGAQPQTAGPVYVGAIIFFLFVLGLFLIRGSIKWWLLTVTIISIMLSWGHNLPSVTNFFLDYFPGYNKFRTVTMILVMAEFAMPLLGILAVNEIIKGQYTAKELMPIILRSFYITGGICLFFIVIASSFNYESAIDAQYLKQGATDFVKALQSDRMMLLRKDAFRSIIFIALGTGALILFLKGKLSREQFIVALGVCILVDLWAVDKRYLNNDDFVKNKTYQNPIQASKADSFIQQQERDGDHYRVLNMGVSTFNDATTSYFHKSLGGYHGAKMRKYQELIEYQLQPEIIKLITTLQKSQSLAAADSVLQQTTALRMLNTRYLIYNPEAMPIINSSALGNAWFVNKIEWVADANQEIAALRNLNPETTAVIQEGYSDVLGDFTPQTDTNASITLSSYAPNKLIYNASTSMDQLAVFSEIYYPKGWEVTIDGEAAEYVSVNYILRAMKVPAGDHEIVFSFKPKAFYTGNKIALASSSLLILLLLGVIALEVKKGMQNKAAE